MGPGAGAARGAARHRARPEHAAAGAAPVQARPLRRARARRADLCRGVSGYRPGRDQARPGAGDPARIWSARRRRAISLCCRTACRPRRSRRSRLRSSRASAVRSTRSSPRSIPSRSAPPRSPRFIARSPPKDAKSRSRSSAPRSRRISPPRSRPTNGPRPRSKRWAARRRGFALGSWSRPSGNGLSASWTCGSRPPPPRSCAKISSRKAAFSSPRSTGAGRRAG